MRSTILLFSAFCLSAVFAAAEVKLDDEVFGKSLGGWKKRDKQAAEYPLSGTIYRSYKPEVTPTPEGGIFISVRIDHVRGWLASDDHATLEITVGPKGTIVSAQSNIAIQGRSISSDVILGGNEAGKQAVGTERAVQIGADLVADLTAKLLREKVVEAGRVSYPSVLRHNYNLLYQAIRVDGVPVQSAPAPVPVPGSAPATLPPPSTTPPPETTPPPTTTPSATTPPVTTPPATTPPATTPPATTPPATTPPATTPPPAGSIPSAAPGNASLEIKL